MNRLITLVEKHLSGKKVLLFFILANVVYLVMLFVTIPATMEYANGMDLLDMRPTGYDLNYVNELFRNLGATGRETYLTNQIPVDMVYPFLFGLSYCLVMAYFLKRLNKLKTPFAYLLLLPILAAIADYAENFGIITMLNSFPDITQSVANTTNVFTLIKSISTSIFFIVLIILLLAMGLKAITKRKGDGAHSQ